MLAQILAIAALGLAPAAPAGAPSERLGDAQLVGQRLVSGFEGTRPPAQLRRRIEAGRLAGVILFESNLESRAQARRLVRELHSIPRPAGLRRPLLVMVDQEGGLVRRLPGPPRLSAEQMGAEGAGTCRRQGAATARMLSRVRINVDLAPVLDVAHPGSAIGSEHRAFGDHPREVARCGGAFASALARGGVIPTAKHFPGLGAARVNTDDAVQRIERSRARLRRVDEAPFADFARDGRRRMVMLSSAIYTAFGPRPAAFTRALAERELRGRLGFRGVSITDALETASTAAFGGPVRAAELAARAGTDLLLFTDLDSARRAAGELRKQLDHRRARERFERSVSRILHLRTRLTDR